MESKYNIAIRRGFHRDFFDKVWLQPEVILHFRGKISAVIPTAFFDRRPLSEAGLIKRFAAWRQKHTDWASIRQSESIEKPRL